jgi:putative membrane protein
MSFDWFFSNSICYGGGDTEFRWTMALPVAFPLMVIASLFSAGTLRLWRRSGHSRPLRLRQGLLFAAGWAVLALAFVSPLHALGERMFTAHMVEHEMLMAMAAPLLAASNPAAAMIWAFPISIRRKLGSPGHATTVQMAWAAISRPAVATILHGITIWAWHIPVLFDAALKQGVLHYAQHASFLGTGLLFWWVILPRPGREQKYGGSVMHLFFTSLHTGLLGVLLLISPRLWYPANARGVDLWGLSALEDQQLAGLVMWVPAGLIYGGAALLLAGLWIRSSGHKDRGQSNAVEAV